MRTIKAVAIIYKEKLYTLPPPARHYHVVWVIREETGDMGISGWQGFLDNNDTFVGRKEALDIAREAGQLIRNPNQGYQGPLLFSEDVW